MILKKIDNKFQITKESYTMFKKYISNDSTKLYLNYVFYNEKLNAFIATDGRVLYISEKLNKPLQPEKNSFFELIKRKKEFFLSPVGSPFFPPNVERVLPDKDNQIVSDYWVDKNITKHNICTFIYEALKLTTTTFTLDCMKTLIGLQNVTLSTTLQKNQIYLTTPKGPQILIMGMIKDA